MSLGFRGDYIDCAKVKGVFRKLYTCIYRKRMIKGNLKNNFSKLKLDLLTWKIIF